jgi:hypothetical protein
MAGERIMISTGLPCSTCGNLNVTQVISQTGVTGKLRWSVSERCLSCETTTELDDSGPIESPFRDKVYADSGRWCLSIEWQSMTVSHWHQFAKLFELSIPDIQNLKANQPTCLGEFTAFEAGYWQSRLAETGIIAKETHL